MKRTFSILNNNYSPSNKSNCEKIPLNNSSSKKMITLDEKYIVFYDATKFLLLSHALQVN